MLKMKLTSLLLFITFDIALSGKCPSKEVVQPCQCDQVSELSKDLKLSNFAIIK